MTDDEVQAVLQFVESYLNGKDGQKFDIGQVQDFKELMAAIRQHVQAVRSVAADGLDDLYVVGAMCLLGPGSLLPPAAMRAELLNILRRYVPDTEERLAAVMEFAIAYGCGKWRTVHAASGGWQQRWEGAERALARALRPAVREANRWLAHHVVGFPQDRETSISFDSTGDKPFPDATAVWSDAWLLALRLTRPEQPLAVGEGATLSITCSQDSTELEVPAQDYQHSIPSGAKAVWTVADGSAGLTLPNHKRLALPTGTKAIIAAGDDEARIHLTFHTKDQEVRLKIGETANVGGPTTLAVWECTCGTSRCLEQHRLEAWDPTQRVKRMLTQWNFVASAVKGPQSRIETNAFVAGMYFPLLAQEGF